MKYIAIAKHESKLSSNDIREYWVLLSNPCNFDEAEEFRSCEMIGEKFEIKTVEEVNNYNFILR